MERKVSTNFTTLTGEISFGLVTFLSLVVKSKLPPRSHSSLEAVEPHP